MNTIKDWLLPKLEELGLTVTEFALESGLSQASVYHYMQDNRRPSLEAITKICNYLEVPVEEGLAQYTDNKKGRPVGAKTVNRSRKRRSTVTRAYREKLFNMLNEEESRAAR